VPRREVLELATLKFIEAREGALLLGPPGVGKSHVAKALAQLAVQRGYKAFYREAHVLLEEINEARELGEIRKYRAQMKAAELLVIDDLFLRKLPANAGDELADVIMSRYEKLSTIITSNRPVGDPVQRWAFARPVARPRVNVACIGLACLQWMPIRIFSGCFHPATLLGCLMRERVGARAERDLRGGGRHGRIGISTSVPMGSNGLARFGVCRGSPFLRDVRLSARNHSQGHG
jgi:energy-coupling factor transporter ATP-binding protein EcfA2